MPERIYDNVESNLLLFFRILCECWSSGSGTKLLLLNIFIRLFNKIMELANTKMYFIIMYKEFSYM